MGVRVVASGALAVILSCLWGAPVQAGQSSFVGTISGSVGAGHGGDIREKGLTLAATIGVLETNGMGAELDLGHTREFDDERFSESGITTLMISPTWALPHAVYRPFVGAGVGLLRVRASLSDGQPIVNRTDWGFNAGGGIQVFLNDAFGIRGDVRYFRFFQRHTDLPLLDNGFFDFWRTSIGVTYAWPIR